MVVEIGYWEHDDEGRPRIVGALRPDAAAMIFYDRLRDRQAQTQPTAVKLARFIRPIKADEDVLEVLGPDSRSGVLDAYFDFLRSVWRVTWRRTLLGMAAGMTFIFCFMNGVASWSRIITTDLHIFVIVQRLIWVAFIGWGVVTTGILIRPKEWMRILGLIGGTLELVVGIPLAVATTIGLERFSLFSLGPILSLILVVVFLWPGLWAQLTGSPAEGTNPRTV